MRKAARMKHKAARAKRQTQELTLGTFNVRTSAFKGVNGIGHIDVLLRICAAKGCDVIGRKETEFRKMWPLDTAFTSVVIAAGSKEEKGNMGLDWQ